jgi:putative endonuclease
MAIVYVLYSFTLDKFYIGASTLTIEERIVNHNDLYYNDKFTSKGIPWTLFWHIGVKDMQLATRIERHIKDMKSKVYIQNLKKYPEMGEKLVNKYTDS